MKHSRTVPVVALAVAPGFGISNGDYFAAAASAAAASTNLDAFGPKSKD
jgi:hypothetical protein